MQNGMLSCKRLSVCIPKMKKLLIIGITVPALLAGCSSIVFKEMENDEYAMFKTSDACAAGMPSQTLDYLREEAVKFCAARKEKPKEISSRTTVGIPIVRCADAFLRFRCEPK